eukprot:Protomagalhaensia_sp_Gyna_25__3269@NODE_2970_length_795_cov_43_621693_g2480_i0_p1_GENE_NODE_2970_length_795_cov_43_621693_g2480_i0NODE_2970_length_795_cov_43_621693_g2480_i0_p1_ORF_typecomplete_len165_score34_33_NODE_2970_length_795_cov_43_621693_g2480_i0121615
MPPTAKPALPFLDAIKARGNAPPSASKPATQAAKPSPSTAKPKPPPVKPIKQTAPPVKPQPAAKQPSLPSKPPSSPQREALLADIKKQKGSPCNKARTTTAKPSLRTATTTTTTSTPPCTQPSTQPSFPATTSGLRVHKSGKYQVIVDPDRLQSAFQRLTCKYG